MEDENCAFDKMELLRQESVEDHGEEQHGDDEQRTVPGLVDVPVVVQNEEALDLGSCDEGTEGAAGLVAEDTEPANLETDCQPLPLNLHSCYTSGTDDV